MANRQPDTFPVPVTGQVIPRGWFARLVAFMNSLILRGDGEYLLVNRTNAGTTIRPTTKLIDLLSAHGGAPASSGGVSTGIRATVSGGTASVTASGSDPLLIEQGANIQITGGTAGELIISATGGTAGSFGPPDYANATVAAGDVLFDTTYGPYAGPVWIVGTIQADHQEMYTDEYYFRAWVWIVGTTGYTLPRIDLADYSFPAPYGNSAGDFSSFVCVSVPAGQAFQFRQDPGMNASITGLSILPCLV